MPPKSPARRKPYSNRRAAIATRGQQKLFSPIEQPERDALTTAFQAPVGNIPGVRTPGNSNLRPDNRRVHKDDVVDPVRLGHSRGLFMPTTAKYLQMICHYRNESSNPPRNLPGTIPICAYMGHDWFPRRRNKGEKALKLQYLTDGLNAAGLTAATFQDFVNPVRYIFIPVEVVYVNDNARTHATLLVVSPSARTIEWLDSDANPGIRQIQDMCLILCSHLGANFNAHEWKIQTDRSFNQNSAAVDCAIHSTANAMALAFGYNFHNSATLENPVAQGAAIRNRRDRFATEILHGRFEAENQTAGARNPYFYPLNPLVVDNDPADGWIPIPDIILAALPVANRPAKPAVKKRTKVPGTRTYRAITSKVAMRAHCAAAPKAKYRGYSKFSGAGSTLDDFKIWVGDRDYEWEEKSDAIRLSNSIRNQNGVLGKRKRK